MTLSDEAREVRRKNAIALNARKRERKAAAAAAAQTATTTTAPPDDQADIEAMIVAIVDKRIEEKFTQARTSSNWGQAMLLAINLLTQSNLVPAIAGRLSSSCGSGSKNCLPAPQPSDGMAEYLGT